MYSSFKVREGKRNTMVEMLEAATHGKSMNVKLSLSSTEAASNTVFVYEVW